ncbi:MAG: hypothetical protein JSU68_11800 [Phycisphaerales bacterium]|nr:MAG: hypothetical protein JSU68_11800 [Phycisphaerales bacterium]
MPEQRPSRLTTESSHARLAAEGMQGRIPTSVICDSCGYNLKGSPFVSTCPECGSPYNARRALGKNIYRPGTLQFPWADMAILAFCVFVGTVLGLSWFSVGRFVLLPVAIPIPIVTIAAALATVIVGRRVIPELREYRRWQRWEKMHADSFAEEREEKEARRAKAADAKKTAPRRPPVMPSEEMRERLRIEGHLADLDWPALCATCGYRLQGLPKLGLCPECGGDYDARPNRMINVLSPYGGTLPWGDIWAAVICAVFTLLMVRSFLNSFSVIMVVLAVLFASGAVSFGAVAAHKTKQYRYAQHALKQIQAEEQDE